MPERRGYVQCVFSPSWLSGVVDVHQNVRVHIVLSRACLFTLRVRGENKSKTARARARTGFRCTRVRVRVHAPLLRVL